MPLSEPERSEYLDLSRCYDYYKRPIRWSEYPRRVNLNESRRVLSAPDEFVVDMDHNFQDIPVWNNSSYVDMKKDCKFKLKSQTSFSLASEVYGIANSKLSQDSGIDVGSTNVSLDLSEEAPDFINAPAQVREGKSFVEECREKLIENIPNPMKKCISQGTAMKTNNLSNLITRTGFNSEEVKIAIRTCHSEVKLSRKINESFYEAKHNPVALPSPSEMKSPFLSNATLEESTSTPFNVPFGSSLDANRSDPDIETTPSSSEKVCKNKNLIRMKSFKLFAPKFNHSNEKRHSLSNLEFSENGLTKNHRYSTKRSTSINLKHTKRSLISLVAATSKLLKSNSNNIEPNNSCNTTQELEFSESTRAKSFSAVFSTQDLLQNDAAQGLTEENFDFNTLETVRTPCNTLYYFGYENTLQKIILEIVRNN